MDGFNFQRRRGEEEDGSLAACHAITVWPCDGWCAAK